tara:strand:+ start:1045 stop:2886 length:1842 start_codon:yes stop_codon:yes gene_type:complete
MTDSGVVFRVDALDAGDQRLSVEIEVNAPFTSASLKLSFPRWVPGSYFLREPIQHVSHLKACDGNGNVLKVTRKEVDSIVVKDIQKVSKVCINYQLLCVENTVRSNHFDDSHLHLMPPFTWFLPTSGIAPERMDKKHLIEFILPSNWNVSTQLNLEGQKEIDNARHCSYSAEHRDALLDGIAECNANEIRRFTVGGRQHSLHYWDAGGHTPNEIMMQRFIHDMKNIIAEHHALFGELEEPYHTILHLTDGGRGGLEHTNSQTSMVPRTSLQPGHVEDYRDLVSLFSHEYVHQWNVKRLRPKRFLDYDLQREVNTDLLWWFEGATSWIGDIMCLRSGAWSSEDYFADMKRKLKRHHTRSGSSCQSLCEASHEAWIHLYRSHAHSRETQISYYLEGELTMFALDAELRKRSKGENGVCDLMQKMYEKHNIHVEDERMRGVQYNDIRKALTSLSGGRRLGSFLDDITKEAGNLDLDRAFSFFGLKYTPSEEPKRKEGTESVVWENFRQGWLGVHVRTQGNKLKVTSHMQNSPARERLQVGDEIVAIDALRVVNAEQLKSNLKGKVGTSVRVMFARNSVMNSLLLDVVPEPNYPTVSTSEGNRLWKSTIRSRQVGSE